MAQQVTKPVEETLNTISGVKKITSTSNEGRAQITVEFNDGIKPDDALQDVREKVNQVVPRLPTGVDAPTYQKFDPNTQPVLQLAISSSGAQTPLQLRQLIDNDFVPAVQRVAGVGSVDISGGQVRQFNVLLNLAQIQARGVAPSQVSSAISNANTNIGLGSVDSGNLSYSLRVPPQIQTPDEIAQLPISGTNYNVGDVAQVEDGVQEATSFARLDGRDAVTLQVVKQSGTNTVSVANGAKTALTALFAQHPDLKYVITNDQSTQVTDSVNSSIEEIILAVVAAFLVVLLFFRNLRNTIVTMAGLPIILIFNFVVLYLFGISLNVISLLALSLSVGLVIDDAIVVRENIFRYLERGYSPRQAASRATAEVSLSVLAMTLTVISVFLPVTLVSGTTGTIFRAFGLTVAGAMAISLVEAFTFAPMLSANVFKQTSKAAPALENAAGAAATAPLEDPDEMEEHEELGLLGRTYERMLNWSLRHRLAIVGIAIVFLVLSVVVARGLKFSFLPPQSSAIIAISFTEPPGTTLATTDAAARQGEAIIQKDPDVANVQTSVGGNGGAESGAYTVRVKNSKLTDAVRQRLRKQIGFLPQVVFGAQSFGGSTTGVTGRNIQIQLRTARTLDTIAPVAAQVQQAVAQVPGAVDVGSTYLTGKPEIQFFVDNAKARDLGVNANSLAATVRALINGDTATTLSIDGDDVDAVVQLPKSDRANINELTGLSLTTAGGSAPLSSLAQITLTSGPTSIRRAQQQYEIVIGANVAEGKLQADVQREIQQAVAKLNVPSTVFITYGGDQQSQTEGFSGLFVAMGLSVLFVYMVLASQFGSFLQPLVIMLAMPFSFLGAFLALRAAGAPLDITGIIGLIMLLGLVTKNSILLVDFTNKLRRRGIEKNLAIARAGGIRLRPILMTSIAIIAGALPTALGIHIFSSGEGGEFRRSLAIVLIGGMATSTLLTLLVVPTAYSILESITTSRRQAWPSNRRPYCARRSCGCRRRWRGDDWRDHTASTRIVRRTGMSMNRSNRRICMKSAHISVIGMAALALALALAACGGPASPSGAASGQQAATAQADIPTPLPTSAPTSGPLSQLSNTVSAIGEVKAEQTADLVFTVNGTVAQVFVKEGDVVTATQPLAQLNQSTFELKVRQAQAALDSANAAQSGLEEAPDKNKLAQSQASLRQAQINLAQTKNNQSQNLKTSQSQLSAAESSLQQTRDRLSTTKNQSAESLQQAVNALTQAQTSYATAKKNWEYVQATGNDPVNPSITNGQGKKVANKLKDTQVQQYYDTFVKADAALSSAQAALNSAQLSYDNARQAEVTGVQQAEEQVAQSQASLNKQLLPSNADSVAAAQAQLDQSRAGLAQVFPNPTKAQRASATAGVATSQTQVEAARLDLENATLRAPFDGVVSIVNIDPGDSSSTSGQPAVSVVDVSKLHVDVPISDVDIGKVNVGQAVKVVVDGAIKDVYAGKVSYIAPTASTSTSSSRTFVVRIVLDNSEGLRPGMRGRAVITLK